MQITVQVAEYLNWYEYINMVRIGQKHINL